MTRRRALVLALVWTLPSVSFLALVTWVYQTWRIDVPERLSAGGRRAIVGHLQQALAGTASGHQPADHPDLGRRLPAGGPMAVSLFLDGRRLARLDGYGATVREAMQVAAELMNQHPDVVRLVPAARALVRLKVDLVVGRGPIALDHPLQRRVALHPGLEGLGVVTGDEGAPVHHLLMPDELILEGLLGKLPLGEFLPQIGMGLDLVRADRLLAAQAGHTATEWQRLRRRYYRFRTDSFVTSDDGVVPLVRGLPDGPAPTVSALTAGALAGAGYLVRHLATNGRYIYEQNLTTGYSTDPRRARPYSLPRHAGTTYFLAEVYRLTGEPWLREPIERAFDHLDTLVRDSDCVGRLPDGADFACVVDRGEPRANLGSTALTVVALVEYERATAEPRYRPLAVRLSEWLLWMQRPDGSFRHLYDVATRQADDETMLLYFSGEAALALARMYLVTGDERYATAAERALDWLVGWYDDFFVGGFLYGEEHWTCIAAEALLPRVKKSAYLDFCAGLSRFWGEMQPRRGDHPDQPDLVGSHGLTPFLMPQNTPAGSHSEARISTYLLGRAHGRPDRTLRREILETLGYLLRQQIRPASAYAVAPGARGVGAIPGNPVDRIVRIDYVQHACSAMIRGVELAAETAGLGTVKPVIVPPDR